MPKRALVLSDIQNDYFPGGRWALSGIDVAADNAAKLLAAARKAGDLVVHVRHEFPSADAPFFAPGSAEAQIHPKARNLDGEPVVLKHHVLEAVIVSRLKRTPGGPGNLTLGAKPRACRCY